MEHDDVVSRLRRRGIVIAEIAVDVLAQIATTARSAVDDPRSLRLLSERLPRLSWSDGLQRATANAPQADSTLEASSRRAEEPSSTHADQMRRIFDKRLAALSDNWNFEGSADPVEALHDLRVASRRLRALLDMLEGRFQPEQLKRPKKELRRVTRSLGRLREWDVNARQLDRLRRSTKSGVARASIEYLAERTDRRRSLARKRTLEAMGGIRKARTKLELAQVSEALAGLSDVELTHIAWEALRKTVDEMFERAPSATAPEDPERMHAMRISAKRLRYVLEGVRPTLGEDFGRLHTRVKSLQEVLGDHHDAMLLEAQLTKQARRLGKKGRTTLAGGLRDTAQLLAAQRAGAFQKFRKRRADMDHEQLLAEIRRALRLGEVVDVATPDQARSG